MPWYTGIVFPSWMHWIEHMDSGTSINDNHKQHEAPDNVAHWPIKLRSRSSRRSAKKGNPYIVHPSLVCLPGGIVTPADRARQFYFKEKFLDCVFAQNLAKANIKKDDSDATLDETGRFSSFKLDDQAKNAQLQCFELFPLAISRSNHRFAPIHQEGFRLMLKSFDFVEKYPDEHVGPQRIGVDCPEDRLKETELNKLHACIIVSLTSRELTLSAWELEHLNNALAKLSRLFIC